MQEKRFVVYDTTLRDGTQGGGLELSVDDKLRIAKRLDEARFDYIEGGWPGSNPTDVEFFQRAGDLKLSYSKIAAFGSTRLKNIKAEADNNLRLLLEARTPTVTIFGKSSEFHVASALETTLDENLQMIYDSVAYLKSKGREVVYDAEHFFDGFSVNKEYALATLEAARTAGANWIVLCDTNGGTDFDDVRQIISAVKRFPDVRYGIHPHNDSDYATANAMAAIKDGFEMVQGTLNGYGERIGNGNLITILTNAYRKGFNTAGNVDLSQFRFMYQWLCDVANIQKNPKLPFVGDDAFAHKGGIHVSAVLKDPGLYEHMDPEIVGNERRFYMSDLAGASNVEAMLGIDRKDAFAKELVAEVKRRVHQGYSYEAALGSLELLKRNMQGISTKIFEIENYYVKTWKKESNKAGVIIMVNGARIEKSANSNDGPVNALDLALRQALVSKYQELNNLKLIDYKVRVISDEAQGTASKVRVIIVSSVNGLNFGTVGVSKDIIKSSLEALVDSYEYAHIIQNS